MACAPDSRSRPLIDPDIASTHGDNLHGARCGIEQGKHGLRLVVAFCPPTYQATNNSVNAAAARIYCAITRALAVIWRLA